MKQILIFGLTIALIFSMIMTSCQKQLSDSADINALKSEVAALQKSTDSLAAALAASNINQGNLSARIDSIQSRLASITSQISSLTSQLAQANANIVAIESQLNILNQEYAQLLAEVNSILGPQKQFNITVFYVYQKAPVFDTTQWHYVAVIFYPTRETQIYIDGVREVDFFREDLPYSYSSLLLGATLYTAYTGFYNGLIDELRVSNIARSQEEIQDYYTNAQANLSLAQVLDASTIGLWHFDENTGSSFANAVPSSIPGTLYGNTSFVPGKSGNAIHFDGVTGRGNCNISIPTAPLTIEFWFKSSTPNGCIVQPYGIYSSNIDFLSN